MTFNSRYAEIFRPALKDSDFYRRLNDGIRERKGKRQHFRSFAFTESGLEKLLHTVRHEIPQIIGCTLLDRLRYTVLFLDGLHIAIAPQKLCLAYAQAGTSHVEDQELSLLLARWIAHDPSYVHWL